MRKHPTDEEILVYCELGPQGPAGSAVLAHLDLPCRQCLAKAGGFQEVLAALRLPPLRQAPEAWVQQALAWIRREETTQILQNAPAGQKDAVQKAARLRAGLKAASRGTRKILEEIHAGLVLDTHAGAALAGIRGTASAQPRQLLYQSPLGSVHVRIETEPGRTRSGRATGRSGQGGKLDLLGQLSPASGDFGIVPARAILLREGSETREGTEVVRRLSANGEFRFRAVTPGRIQLWLEWNNHRLTLDPLELPAEQDD